MTKKVGTSCTAHHRILLVALCADNLLTTMIRMKTLVTIRDTHVANLRLFQQTK